MTDKALTPATPDSGLTDLERLRALAAARSRTGDPYEGVASGRIGPDLSDPESCAKYERQTGLAKGSGGPHLEDFAV